MSLLFRVLHVCLGGCSHRHTYRERRTLHGIQVLHWVCDNCGHAVPVVDRTAREHRQVVENGAVKAPRAHRIPAGVIAIDSRPARSRRSA